MRDGIRSMLRFSWAMSLFGAQQAAELMSALGSARSPRRAEEAFDTVTGAAAEQLDGSLKDAWSTGERQPSRYAIGEDSNAIRLNSGKSSGS